VFVASVWSAQKPHFGWIRFADDEEVQAEVRKWLRQQSKDFYAAGFEALIKRLDQCINIDEEYVKKYMFLPGSNSNITSFAFYIHL
jgi:(p)ppGpp synthase/HD superfamily hydrolase